MEAAQDELAAKGMASTDSALTLLSGIHRKDVRQLLRGEEAVVASAQTTPDVPLGLAGEVVGRWLSDPAWLDAQQHPLRLARSGETTSFDALVASVSRDVRPKAMLDELLRLGAVTQDEQSVALVGNGFWPSGDLQEKAQFLAQNVGDHAAAAVANLQDGRSFLEQAIYVDDITAESARHLHKVAAKEWHQAMTKVLREAQLRFDDDAIHATAEQRTQRARFGVYFFDGIKEE